MSSLAFMRSAEYERLSGRISTEPDKDSSAMPRSALLCSPAGNHPDSDSALGRFLQGLASLGWIFVLWWGLLGDSMRDSRSSGSPRQLLVAPPG